MTKKHYLLCMALWLSGLSLWAQKPVATETDHEALRQMSLRYRALHESSFKKAYELARKYGWPIEGKTPNGDYFLLNGLDDTGMPQYYMTESNRVAGRTIRAFRLWTNGGLGLNLNGENMTIGEWDSGVVRGTHQELTGRVTQMDGATTGSDHGTHVAGTILASGVNPEAKGMAPAARLNAYDFGNDLTEMIGAAPNLQLSNHSYGSITGWNFGSWSGTQGWHWWGGATDNEDWKFGIYNSQARSWDELAVANPTYLIVKSAGNNRSNNGPAAGGTFFQRPAGSNTWEQRNISEFPGRSRNDGFDIIATSGNAKNIMTVAAIEGIETYTGPNSAVMSSFSSWGPTDDGRIKPDISAMGVSVFSCVDTDDQAYDFLNGTSMATPNTTGGLALVQQYFRSQQNRFMRSATLKGLALHTAEEAGLNPGPDYRFGWGVLNVEKMVEVLRNNDRRHYWEEATLANNATYNRSIAASGIEPLVVTICWTDPAGVAIPDGTVDSPNRALVNDLDVRVLDAANNVVSQPWILDPANPNLAATRGDNTRDNIEKIEIPVTNLTPGENYTVRVTHKGNIGAGQAFSVIISGIGPFSYCASAATETGGARISQVTFGAINNPNATCLGYLRFTNQATNLVSGQAQNLSISITPCTNAANTVTKAFIDWNADEDFADAGELIFTSPVTSGAATFNASITPPEGITLGAFARLRIVTVETSDAAAVNACGTYAKGQTHDYRVNFARYDIEVDGISLSTPGFVSVAAKHFPASTTLSTNVRNRTNFGVSNLQVTASASYGTAPSFFSQTINRNALAANELVNVTTTQPFNPARQGLVNVRIAATISEPATNTADDVVQGQVLVDSAYGRSDTEGLLSLAFNNTSRVIVGYNLPLLATDTLTSIDVALATTPAAADAASGYFAVVYATDGTGRPTTEIARSSVRLDPTDNAFNTFSFGECGIILQPGNYFFGISGQSLSSTSLWRYFGSPTNFSAADAWTSGNGGGSFSQISTLSNASFNTRNPVLFANFAKGRSNTSVALTNTLTTTTCERESVTFTANVTAGGTAPAYEWFVNGTPVPNVTTRTFSTTTLSNNDSVSVRVTSNSVCVAPNNRVATAGQRVRVLSAPSVSIEHGFAPNNGPYRLTASITGTAYQWIFNNSIRIPSGFGGNQRTFTPTYPYGVGSYRVEVTNTNGCLSVSPNLVLTVSGLEDTELARTIQLFPNPADERVQISIFNPTVGSGAIRLTDLTGRTLYSFGFEKDSDSYQTTLDISSLSEGVYLLEITQNGQRAVKRLSKQ